MRPFENVEMGLTAVFPVGSRVCVARSGGAPRGFYAWYGGTGAGCENPEPSPPAFMGVDASFNARSYRSLRQAAVGCRPLSPSVGRLLRGLPLSLAGRPSLACQAYRSKDKIRITVYAMAGAPSGDGAPGVIYLATLRSTAGRLERDLSMFQTFLGKLSISLR